MPPSAKSSRPTRSAATPPARPPVTKPAIQPGDICPQFEAADAAMTFVNIDADPVAGKPRLLVFVPSTLSPAVHQTLASLSQWAERLKALDAPVFVLLPAAPPDLADFARRASLHPSFRLLSDPEGDAARGLLAPSQKGAAPAVTTMVLRPNRHVHALLEAETGDHGDVAAAHIESLAEERRWRPAPAPQAPVLTIPDVLSPADCQRLLAIFAMQGNEYLEPGHGAQNRKADYKMRIPDYGRNDRVDHWVMNAETTQFIAGRLFARVAPEVETAFHYKLTRYERFRIGRYVALDSGPGIVGPSNGHRDNVEPGVAHRRFACSVNLNAEAHEGGGLVFPEYSGAEYTPRTGEALVFSSSLLHKVMPVTKGTRFTLLSFLFGET